MVNSVKVNNNSVSFKEGLVVKDFLNQDLNTGILVLPHIQKIDIEPFDLVEIVYNVTEILYFYVATINARVSRFNQNGNHLYNYELGLVSITTRLQRIILPNRSITNSLDGNNDYTIKQVMENYLEIYAPDLSLSTELIVRLGITVCPEQQWNRPTLFEVFNDLLKTIGCVVTMKNITTVHFLDLDTDGDAIDETKLSGLEFNQDMREYASELEIDASNVYDSSSSTKTPEHYIPKTTEQGLLTDANAQIILNKPIFEIVSLVVKIWYSDPNAVGIFNYYDVDITDRVVTKTVWDTFWTTNNAGLEPDTATKKYQRNYLWFNEGDNKIQGLSFRETDWIPGFDVTHWSLTNIVYYELVKENTPLSLEIAQQLISNNLLNGLLWRDAGFIVEYRSNENLLFKVRKDNPVKNKTSLISSQQNSLINIDTFSKQQQEFINRTGNKEMIITGKYTNLSDIPSLNDYIGDFILTEREIQIHDTFFNFKGILSEYYSKDNLFAGINTAKRYTSIALPKEASISNHLTEVDLEISNKDANSSANFYQTELYLVESLGIINRGIQGAVVVTDQTDTGLTGNRLLLETTAHKIGKSFIVTLNMEDNFNSSLKLEPQTGFTAQKMMQHIPYVDTNGRFEQLKIELYRDDTNYLNRGIAFESLYTEDGALYNFDQGLLLAESLPALSSTGSKSTDGTPNTITSYATLNATAKVFNTGTSSNNYVKRYKDNREITYETIQFFFGTSVDTSGSYTTKRIIIGDTLIDFMPPIIKNTKNFRVAYSSTLEYNIGDKKYKGSLLPTAATTISRVGNKIEILNVSPYTTWDTVKNTIKSYAICDNEGNILIAVNKSGNYEPLYLNRKT